MEIKPFYSGRMAYDITADNGEKYVFVPKEFAEKGFVLDGKQWYEPEFLKDGAFDKASTFTLPDDSAISKQAKALYKDPTQGYIWKAEDYKPINSDDFYFQSYKITDEYPAIEGLSRVKNQWNDQLVYKVPTKEGWQQSYIWGQDKENGTHFRSTKVEQGRSLLGEIFGGVGDTLASAFNSGLDAINSLGPIPNLAIAAISPTTAAAIASANAGQAAATGNIEGAIINAGKAAILSNIGSSTDPNAVGGVTGPDNIDVGGGWSPATGATAAELEAARLALEKPVTAEEITNNIAATKPELTTTPTTTPTVTPEVTAEAITKDIAAQPTPEAIITPESQIDYTKGNYSGTEASSFLTPDEISYYGPITDAEMTAAKEAAASTGWTFKQALDAVRAGLLVNAITGDPLGLSGTQSGNVGGGSTGFDIVPIPSEWKSPTYTTSQVTNVTFEDLFPGVSLQGTQWAGLQNAKPNISFNDIFASGSQSTPMGTPVNINDIVGAIIGQSTKS